MSNHNQEWRKKKALYFVPKGYDSCGVGFHLTGSKKRGYRVQCGGWYDSFIGISCQFSEQDRLDLIEMLQMADNTEAYPRESRAHG